MSTSIKKLKDLEINLVKHSNATSIVLAFYGKSYKELKDKKGFMAQKSDIYGKKLSVKQTIEETKRRGLWGFCSYNKGSMYREIHYWIDKGNVDLCDIGELLCHEVAHATGVKSENYAIRYAYVASTVIQFLMRDFVLKGKKKE